MQSSAVLSCQGDEFLRAEKCGREPRTNGKLMLLLPPLSTRWSFANSGRPEHLVIQSLPGLNGYIPNLFVIVFMVALLMMLLHALTIADFTEIFDDLKLGFTQSSTFVVGGKSSSI
jgi:hypothetical protein